MIFLIQQNTGVIFRNFYTFIILYFFKKVKLIFKILFMDGKVSKTRLLFYVPHNILTYYKSDVCYCSVLAINDSVAVDDGVFYLWWLFFGVYFEKVKDWMGDDRRIAL